MYTKTNVGFRFKMSLFSVFKEKNSFIVGAIYIPSDDEQMLNKLCGVVDSLMQDKTLMYHHKYWGDNSINKFGVHLHEYTQGTQLQKLNNETPTRKDKIIVLSISSLQITE